jgi:hypothetical protein
LQAPSIEDTASIEEADDEDSVASIWGKVTMMLGDSSSKAELRSPPRYLEDLKTQQFSVLIQDLRQRLMQSGGKDAVDAEALKCLTAVGSSKANSTFIAGQHTQHYLDVTAALEEKYNALLKRKREPHPATADEVNELLKGKYIRGAHECPKFADTLIF